MSEVPVSCEKSVIISRICADVGANENTTMTSALPALGGRVAGGVVVVADDVFDDAEANEKKK